jgi:hypothetical protein
MNLYIKVKDNKPFEHPISEENLRYFFPDISPQNIPEGYAIFCRLPQPVLLPYEVLDGCEYMFKDGKYWDCWKIRPMTLQEKNQAIQEALMYPPFPSWSFSEESYDWIPPVPRPTDGNEYRWNEETLSWKLRIETNI